MDFCSSNPWPIECRFAGSQIRGKSSSRHPVGRQPLKSWKRHWRKRNRFRGEFIHLTEIRGFFAAVWEVRNYPATKQHTFNDLVLGPILGPPVIHRLPKESIQLNHLHLPNGCQTLWKVFFRFSRTEEVIYTLPETNSSPLKIDPWKRRFLLETTIFRGYVSFRECIVCGTLNSWMLAVFI